MERKITSFTFLKGAMEELLGEELLAEQKLEEYTRFRDDNAQSLLSL